MTPALALELARLKGLAAPGAPAGAERIASLRALAGLAGPPPRPEAPGARLPVGLTALDAVIGGFPGGRPSEIVGPASAGKTTLAISLLRRTAGMAGTRPVAMVDLTRTVFPRGAWARDLLVVRPARLDLGLRALDVLVASAAFSLIVLHAPASLRALPDALRVRVTRLCRETGTAIVACSEHAIFGSCAALRLDLAPSPDGRMRVRVSKNRQGPLLETHLPWRATAGSAAA